MRRRKMSNHSSKKFFKKGALRVKAINATGSPMRGGIRL